MSSLLAEATDLEAFERFCLELSLEDGKPMHLYQEQRWILEDVFDHVREIAVLMCKKNGKTTLIAALAIYHLIVTPNAECIIVAASREQAEILLRQARMFVRQSDALKRVMAVKQREIVSLLDEGRIRVLASDADTADGTLPTLAIVDELHRHKSFDLYTVLRQGLGARDGQLITISTAGTAAYSPLGELRRLAHLLPGFERRGKYNHVRTANFAFHEWCLDDKDNVDDMGIVKLVNPAPWMTEEALAERHASPSMTTWDWLRFACGIWTEGEKPWIEPPVWDERKGPDEPTDVAVGVDVGVRGEEPAVVIVGQSKHGWATRAFILPKGSEFFDVEELLRDLKTRYRVGAVGFDPRSTFLPSAENLASEGFEMVEFPQTAERMSKASATLWHLIQSKKITHDGDDRLRAHVLSGIVKEDGRGWRFTKDPVTRRPVSGLIALAMAAHLASETQAKEYWVL